MFKRSQTERVLSFEHTSTATTSSPGAHAHSGEVHLTSSSSSSSASTRGSSEVQLFAYVFPAGLLGRWMGRCLRLRVGRFQCTVEGPHGEKKGRAPSLSPPRARDGLSREDFFSSSSSFPSAQEAPFLGVRVVEVEVDSVVPEMEVFPPSNAWRKKFALVEKQREKQKKEKEGGEHLTDASRFSPFSSSSSSTSWAAGKWRRMTQMFRPVPHESAPPPPPPHERNGTESTTQKEAMQDREGLRGVPLSDPTSATSHDAKVPPPPLRATTLPIPSSSPPLSPPLFPPRVSLTYSERNKVQKRLLSSTMLHADRFPLIWYDIEAEDSSSLTGELYVRGVGQLVRCHKYYSPRSSAAVHAAALPPPPPPLFSTTTTSATSSSSATPVEGSSTVAEKESGRMVSVPYSPPSPPLPPGDGFLHIHCSIPDIEAYGITKPSLWMRLFTISSTVEVEAKIPIDINLS